MGLIGQAFDHIIRKEEITELSVVLYTDSFFCGYWAENGDLLKCAYFSMDQFASELKSWNTDYSIEKIQLINTSIPFLHLPQSQFESKHYENYFEGIYDLRKCLEKEKELDAFAGLPINTLHYPDASVLKLLKGNKIPFRLGHISTSLSNYASLRQADFIVYMHESMLHIVCHKNGGFLFYNQFYCTDVNDYLYFILMCLQVLEYDQATQNIHMAGEIDDTSQLYKKMKSYLPGLTLINGEMNFRASVESPAQIYFDLFLAKSCV